MKTTCERLNRRRASDRLTFREVEVVSKLLTGRSNKQIADELVVSVYTVQNHLQNIYSKLGVSSRTQVIYLAHSGAITDLLSEKPICTLADKPLPKVKSCAF